MSLIKYIICKREAKDFQTFLQQPFNMVRNYSRSCESFGKANHVEMLIKTLAYETIDDLKDTGDKSNQKWLLGRPLP